MTWSLVETEWDIPFSLRPFVFIFLFLILWIPYVAVSHYVLRARLQRHFKRMGKWWRDNGEASGPKQRIDHFLESARNPQIQGFYKAVSDMIAETPERAGRAAASYQADIEYFLGKKVAHLKALAIVLLFAMAGFLLMGLKRMIIDEAQVMSIVFKEPWFSKLLANLPDMFYHWIYYPLVIALAETFLIFWLINSTKRLGLRLRHDMTVLSTAIADRSGRG